MKNREYIDYLEDILDAIQKTIRLIFNGCALQPQVVRQVDSGFRGVWRNAANFGKGEDEIIALWNEVHPTDPIAP